MKLHVVSIDQQKDFCDPNGSLFVKGANENTKRAARMITRLIPKISEIHVTMDSHRRVDISHPVWWLTNNNVQPGPITKVTLNASEEFELHNLITGEKCIGKTRSASAKKRTTDYLKLLKANNRYEHTIWPNHCIIGDEGHNFDPDVAAAVHEWEETRYAVANIVTKGSNPWTEHFSAIQAEVPDPEDPSTQINTRLISSLETADIVVWVGEALSHCLANTFRDTIQNFSSPDFIKKQYICLDATSSVPGFESFGDTFVSEMRKKGVNFTTTKDFLA